jgi:hypothetical protein
MKVLKSGFLVLVISLSAHLPAISTIHYSSITGGSVIGGQANIAEGIPGSKFREKWTCPR